MIDASLRARAIEGDARAQYEIGERFRMAYYDSFTPFSSSLFLWEEAVKWYELAANQGYGKAQYQLSVFYFPPISRDIFRLQRRAIIIP